MAKKPTKTNDAPADPAPAEQIDSASGAIVEPEIVDGVQTDHPAIDDNPRAGTEAVQNRRDMNDPKNRRPGNTDFVGQGLDPAPYGTPAED
ncbi:hypothetical protein AAD018_013770 [Aestuariibius insulae]|uniref:hypothetical protein n=1 Tax=Aestuariibius insulae TaxID=2058287 RepID=UPI00345E51C7